MQDQRAGCMQYYVSQSSGVYCDLALFEADGNCRVIASHAKRTKLSPGVEFFSAVGVTGSEAQFALHELLDLRTHFVLIRSEAGAVLLTDYFYLSVRLILAIIPNVKADSAARVSHNCYPEIVLSPSFRTLKMEPVAGDESAYVLLQQIRDYLLEGFPHRYANETSPADEVIRTVYHSAQMLAELIGSRFRMAYPESGGGYQIRYDPVIGTLCLLVYFCYVDRTEQNSDIQLSVLPSFEDVRMELGKAGPDLEKWIPELSGLRDLERYSRQIIDFVREGDRVTLRLFLAPAEDLNLLGLKCYSPADCKRSAYLEFDLSVAE